MALSGSLRELSRAVNAFLTSPSPSLPLPDDIHQVLEAYLRKHERYDEGSSTRLHDDFLATYQKQVRDRPDRLPAFVAILRHLLPCMRSPARIFQWWDLLCEPILAVDSSGTERELGAESLAGMVEILMSYSAEDHDQQAGGAGSGPESDGGVGLEEPLGNPFVERLLYAWMDKYNPLDGEGVSSPALQSAERRVKEALLTFGKKKPKEFMIGLDKCLVKKMYRKLALQLLSEFVQSQPPHLHQVLQTPLFGNLLRCLRQDTSTTVVSMALTAFIMLLPHMPSSLVPHLPAMFNIYARLLFWDQERTGAIEAPGEEMDQRPASGTGVTTWETCSYNPDSDELTVPHLMNYFTILYGLYPINFMDYIRKPQRYLRHANAPNTDEIEVQPTEIRHKSERFRQCHLLHPNFYTLTIESERTDFGRWIKSDPADVVAECMALCAMTEPSVGEVRITAPPLPGTASPISADDVDQDGTDGALLSGMLDSHLESWRYTQSTAVDSPPNSRVQSAMLRQSSQSSHPSNRDSVETRNQHTGGDSPTLPPHLHPSSSHTQLQDMINSNKAIKSGLHQSLANDSVPSLSLSHHDSIPERSQTLPLPPVSVSPLTSSDPATQVAQLKRQVLLLQNDLSFERYLKQQHMTHIGVLRRRQVREAATEAETQNLVMHNRQLKTRLEDAKKAEMQARREAEKRQTLAKKWEADLSTKLKTLREDSRRSKAEEDALRRDLRNVRLECETLRKLLCDAEVKELNARQAAQVTELDAGEIDRLRGEVERLTVTEREHQSREMEREIAIQTAAEAENRMEILSMKLSSRELELQRTKKLFQAQIVMLNSKLVQAQEDGRVRAQLHGYDEESANAVVESALAASRAKQAELQRQYGLLMRKYTALQSSLLDIRAAPIPPPPQQPLPPHPGSLPMNPSPPKNYHPGAIPVAGANAPSFLDDGETDYGSGGGYPVSRSATPLSSSVTGSHHGGSSHHGRTRPHRVFSDPETFEPATYGQEYSKPGTPVMGSGYGQGQSGQGYGAAPAGAGSSTARPGTPPGNPDTGSGGQSPDQRYFGRGGVQNRIRKDEKEKKKPEEQKGKKAMGLRGLRGFN